MFYIFLRCYGSASMRVLYHTKQTQNMNLLTRNVSEFLSVSFFKPSLQMMCAKCLIYISFFFFNSVHINPVCAGFWLKELYVNVFPQ
jgi:hypothetical protein